MKSCVRLDNEISFAHRKDPSLSMDNEEDTPLSETNTRKRIKRPGNDKTKLSKFEMKRKFHAFAKPNSH